MLGLTSSSLSNADLEALYTTANIPEPAILPFDSGYYYGPYPGNISSSAGVNGRLALTPFFIPSAIIVIGFAFEVTVGGSPAGATFTPCIYNDDKGWPKSPLAVGLASDVTAAVIPETVLSPAVTIPRGWCWIGGLVLGATTTPPTFRMSTGDSLGYPVNIAGVGTGLANACSGTVAAGLSSMPATYPTAKGSTAGSFIPRVFIKTG